MEKMKQDTVIWIRQLYRSHSLAKDICSSADLHCPQKLHCQSEHRSRAGPESQGTCRRGEYQDLQPIWGGETDIEA